MIGAGVFNVFLCFILVFVYACCLLLFSHLCAHMGVSHEICKSTFRLSRCPNFSLRNDRHGVGAAVPRQHMSVHECENAQSVVFASTFSSIIVPIK